MSVSCHLSCLFIARMGAGYSYIIKGVLPFQLTYCRIQNSKLVSLKVWPKRKKYFRGWATFTIHSRNLRPRNSKKKSEEVLSTFFMPTWWEDDKNIKKNEIPQWLFKLPHIQEGQSGPLGSIIWAQLVLLFKSHISFFLTFL